MRSFRSHEAKSQAESRGVGRFFPGERRRQRVAAKPGPFSQHRHLLQEIASGSLRRKSTTLLPAITSKKRSLWAARTKPSSMPTVIGNI